MRPSIVALLAALAMPLAVAQSTPADKPVIKVGQVSVYRMAVLSERTETEDAHTVTSIDGGLVKTRSISPGRTPPERDIVFTPDWNPVVTAFSGSRLEPHADMLRFPLAVGQTWRSDYGVTAANGSRLRASMESTVLAQEKVKVPAGEFDALKVHQKGWSNGVSFTGALRVDQVLWYAPAVGRIVRLEYKDWAGTGSLPRVHFQQELKSYSDPR